MKRTHITPAEISISMSTIRHSVIFAGLTDDQFKEVISCVQIAELSIGNILFARYQKAEEIFWIESGQIKLAVVSQEGAEKTIEIISAGNTFAEAILFGKKREYPVEASAISHSRVWCINSKRYSKMLRQSTDACFAVLQIMSRRLHAHIAEIDRLSLHNATYRVVSYLLEQVPSSDRGASKIHLNIPKHIIASRLSITPETLSRTFSKLCRTKQIDIVDSNIVLKDIDGLKRLIHWDPQ